MMNAEESKRAIDAIDSVRGNVSTVGKMVGQVTRNDGAAPEEWPEPILPGPRATPNIPAHHLPGVFGRMAAAVAASTQTAPGFAVFLVLGVLATVFQRRFDVRPLGAGYRETLSFWVLALLPSGARKSAVFSALVEPFLAYEIKVERMTRAARARNRSEREVARRRVEKLQIEAAKAADDVERESLLREAAKVDEATPAELRAPRLLTTNATPERQTTLMVEHGGRMANWSDEGHGALQVSAGGAYSGGTAIIDAMLTAYSGGTVRTDRAGGRSAHVDQAALTLGLAMQPDLLQDVAGSKQFRASGLLARFWFVWPESTVGRRDVRQFAPVPPDLAQEYCERIHNDLDALTGWEPDEVRPLPLSPAAKELWLDYAQVIEGDMAPGGRLEGLSDWAGKLPGAVARVAGLIELADVGVRAEEVSEVSVLAAIELGALATEHALAVFAQIGADQVDLDAAAILNWVRAHQLPEFRRHEAQRACSGRFANPERLEKALARLAANRVVVRQTRPNKGTRPSTVYLVNPRVFH